MSLRKGWGWQGGWGQISMSSFLRFYPQIFATSGYLSQMRANEGNDRKSTNFWKKSGTLMKNLQNRGYFPQFLSWRPSFGHHIWLEWVNDLDFCQKFGWTLLNFQKIQNPAYVHVCFSINFTYIFCFPHFFTSTYSMICVCVDILLIKVYLIGELNWRKKNTTANYMYYTRWHTMYIVPTRPRVARKMSKFHKNLLSKQQLLIYENFQEQPLNLLTFNFTMFKQNIDIILYQFGKISRYKGGFFMSSVSMFWHGNS